MRDRPWDDQYAPHVWYRCRVCWISFTLIAVLTALFVIAWVNA